MTAYDSVAILIWSDFSSWIWSSLWKS